MYTYNETSIQEIKNFLRIEFEGNKGIKMFLLDLNSGFEVRTHKDNGLVKLVFRLITGEWFALNYKQYKDAKDVYDYMEKALLDNQSGHTIKITINPEEVTMGKALNLWDSF